MESFLSLPRSAKGGLAVLLAVALLGWAIVAYSARQQHEDARGRASALAELQYRADAEEKAISELNDVQERLAAAEAELSTSRETVAASLQEKSDIEARLGELETALAARQQQSEGGSSEGGALGLTGNPAASSEEGAHADLDVLTVTSEERDALRRRLTETMTALSATRTTLQQRERELAKAQAEVGNVAAEIAELKGGIGERDALGERLALATTALSTREATVEQLRQAAAGLTADLDEAKTRIATLEAGLAEQDAAGRSLDALTTELGDTRRALDEGAKTLSGNQEALAEQTARLQDLQEEQAAIETVIGEKQAEIDRQEQRLAALGDSIAEEEQRLLAQQEQADAANAELRDLSGALEARAAESSSLTAEFDSLQADLSDREDAIAQAEAELARLDGEIQSAVQQLAEKQSTLSARDGEIQGVEASLAALKADHAVVEAERSEVVKAIGRQEDALQDLAVLKGELNQTKVALAKETALLDKRRSEVAAADARLVSIRDAGSGGSDSYLSLPRIPIADLGEVSTAILPIDPMQTPIPIQTKGGLRLTVVHFDLGSAELTPGGMKRAMDAAAWIKEQDIDGPIRLIGATDTIGTRADNMVLARLRANSLLEVFVNEGIDPERIELIAMGEAGGSEQIADQTAEPLNRCVGVFLGEG